MLAYIPGHVVAVPIIPTIWLDMRVILQRLGPRAQKLLQSPFLSIVGTAEAFEHAAPTSEESLAYQARLLGLWEQQQRVLGYTQASIAVSSRNLDAFLKVAGKCIWEVSAHDIDQFYEKLVGRGLAYSTRRKYQSNITTFLDYLRSRHAHEI